MSGDNSFLRKLKSRTATPVVQTRSGRRARSTRDERIYRGVRIYFDTQFVNDENTCHRVGEKVRDITKDANFTCTADDVLTADKVKFLGLVLDQANKFLTNTLASLPIEGNLILNGTMDGFEVDECSATIGESGYISLKLPEEYKTTGIPGAGLLYSFYIITIV